MKTTNNKVIFRSTKESSILITAGKKAAQRAIRENKALGLGVFSTKNNKIIKQNPDGSSEIIATIHTPVKSKLKIKKGTILYAKPS
jgi:hypothetical protein